MLQVSRGNVPAKMLVLQHSSQYFFKVRESAKLDMNMCTLRLGECMHAFIVEHVYNCFSWGLHVNGISHKYLEEESLILCMVTCIGVNTPQYFVGPLDNQAFGRPKTIRP
jgi:hypothetical protein